MTLIQKIVELRNEVRKRTSCRASSQEHTCLTERNTAVHASRALGSGRLFGLVHLMYFTVIADTLFYVTVRADRSLVFQESGILTHSSSLLCEMSKKPVS